MTKLTNITNIWLVPLVQCNKKLGGGRSVAQNVIYETAKRLDDEKLLRLCENYDFVSAEAYYHKECYIKYTNTKGRMSNVESVESEEQSAYVMAEEEAKGLLFQFIRNEIINKKDVAYFTDLISCFESLLGAKGVTVDKTAKKKLRQQIKDEFLSTASFFQNNEGRLLFLPNDFSREELALELCELKKR